MELVQLLVTHGAAIDAVTDDGKTALSFAETDGHAAVVDFLKNGYLLLGFGAIHLNAVEESYEASVIIGEKTVGLDINFEASTIPKEALNLVKKILDNFRRLSATDARRNCRRRKG